MPLFAIAYTVQLPLPMTLTLPFLSTVATFTLLLYQRTLRMWSTVFLPDFTPFNLAVRVLLLPTFLHKHAAAETSVLAAGDRAVALTVRDGQAAPDRDHATIAFITVYFMPVQVQHDIATPGHSEDACTGAILGIACQLIISRVVFVFASRRIAVYVREIPRN